MNVPDLIAKKNTKQKRTRPDLPWVWDVLLIGILLIGAYFRFIGVKWDDTYHLHPDERFLTMVETAIAPTSPDQYFDTSTSTLNPNNRGYTYYVYGTLPLFITRYVGEWFGLTGYDQINVVGRVLSGIFDLGTVLLVYLIGRRLYRNARLGLLAALFSALSVLQIQLAHYFAVDTFANFFSYAAIYFAVRIITGEVEKRIDATIEEPVQPVELEKEEANKPDYSWLKNNWESFTNYALFGLMFGMAMASKVSVYPLALLLPIAAFLFYKKVSKDSREEIIPIVLRNLVLAGIIAFFTFRIFQPYAFLGPGFFGLKINQNWLSNLKELSAQSTGDIDVPFALQWARRPITFAWTNMVQWGLGLPLGLLAWAGFLWMTWRMIKGDWQKHLLLWSWVTFIFVSQSMNWVRAMRYQLPVYPGLAIIASWAIFKLWESAPAYMGKISQYRINWKRTLSVTLVVLVVIASGAWAFAFTRIYTRPVTRVAASEWIYEHVSGAFQINIETDKGTTVQPIAYQNGVLISSSQPLEYGFSLEENAELTGVRIEHVGNLQADYPTLSLIASVIEPATDGGALKAAAFTQSTFQPTGDARGDEVQFSFNYPVVIQKNKTYTLMLDVAEAGQNVKAYGSVELFYNVNGKTKTRLLPPAAFGLTSGNEFTAAFIPQDTGIIKGVALNRVVDQQLTGDEKVLDVYLVNNANPSTIIASGSITDDFLPDKDARGMAQWIEFTKPVALDSTQIYTLHFKVTKGSGTLAVYNDTTAIESTWDDALPLQMNGYNAFGYDDGIYGNIQNLEMYWDDNAAKLKRFENILDQTDVIMISSNRQWGTTVRVPERYPLTTAYYRELLGCPEGTDLLKCYQQAQPGMYASQLGFELEEVFQSNPTLGTIQINDQSAEEAFTVYDHPKVLIFRKTDAYDSSKVHALLESVDLTKAVHLTPRQAGKISGNIMLSESQLAVQQAGGTWAELFNPNSLVNQNQWAAVVIWFLTFLFLGWMVYPSVRLALKHLPDHGYPVSRLVGLLLTALLTFWAGSSGLSISRGTISGVLLLLLVVNLVLGYYQRKELLDDWKTKKKYFLAIDLLFLAFFVVDLLIRYGNPDLWHPWRGGEKPMDFSYFNAILKSSTFPPYDPWYAGGYINYYYYGYVIVGVMVKFLGIVPSVAYNLILPTLFAMTAVGAFSIGWNLFAHSKQDVDVGEDTGRASRRAWGAGIISSLMVLILGNLGTLRMIWQGLQKLVAPNAVIDGVSFFQHLSWAVQGLGKMLSGVQLPYGYGDWLWIPSRSLPGDTITEFPFFTFTYADLHAHMIALPITLLAIVWAISIVRSRWNWWQAGKANGWITLAASILLGGVVIGALRPTNTWDYPTYLLLSAFFIVYSIFRYARLPEWLLPNAAEWIRRTLYAAGVLVVFVLLTYIFYLPFIRSYAQAYGSIDVWKGDRSPFWSYINHWGLFFFVLISWMVWETREWLAATPASAIHQIRKYSGLLQTVLVLFAVILMVLIFLGVQIAWIAFPMAVWTLILLCKPDMPDVKRIVFFMVGTGLLLTLFVELFALEGDIGRMNMVFKFYYQAWSLFALSSAAALVWLIPAVTTRWKINTSTLWQAVLAVLVFGAALYPITAARDKIRDRIDPAAAHTLDGAAYMATSTYQDQGTSYTLKEDYDGIRWMQENVIGSPVILEGNTVEYRWGNRYTIYTGLPGILGWNYHQRQQRGFIDSNGIANRLNDITIFYTTSDVQQAVEILQKYNVKYIILGQMEQAYYPGDGLLKFDQFDGTYWKSVFRENQTVIYEVIQ